MPLFILNAQADAQVPGTQTYEKRTQLLALQKVPVPSSSVKDPLNWPLARKNFILFILCVHSILAAVLNPILAVNTFQLIPVFKVSFTKIAMLTGYNVLALAIAALFFSATCTVYGRRHTFIIGSLFMVVGNLWAANANTYGSMLGARIVQGIGIAPFEGLIQVVVADMYFVSQRGRAYACVAVSYTAGAMVTPIITGKLSIELGRRAPFYLAGGFTAACFLLVFFFFEETAFVRDNVEEAQITRIDIVTSTKSAETAPGSPDLETSVPSTRVTSEVNTFAMAHLSLFSGRYSDESLIKLICRPVFLLIHPAVMWGAATAGTITAWTVMLATVLAAIFALKSPAELGYMYSAPLVAVFITFPLAGLSSDYIAKTLTRRYGVYEPEYRILLIVPFTVVAMIGLFGFGHSIKMHEIVPTVFFGFVISAVIFGSVASATYVADAYQLLDVDCFIAFLLVKNLLAFALTVKGFDWLVKDGVKKMFNTCGYIQLAVCAVSLPMFFFGKALRNHSAKSSFWQWIFQ